MVKRKRPTAKPWKGPNRNRPAKSLAKGQRKAKRTTASKDHRRGKAVSANSGRHEPVEYTARNGVDDSEIISADNNSADHWAQRILGALRKTVESIIEAGRLLIEAKAALPHGEFEAMVERDLSFTVRTAEHFMRIARDERITNPKLASLLPPSWYSLSELTRLTDDEFDTALENGSINPEMQRVEVKTLVVGRRSTVEPKLVPIEAVSKFDPTAAKSGDTRGMQQPTTPAEQVRARYIELLRSLDKKTRTAEIFNLMKDVGIAVGGG